MAFSKSLYSFNASLCAVSPTALTSRTSSIISPFATPPGLNHASKVSFDVLAPGIRLISSPPALNTVADARAKEEVTGETPGKVPAARAAAPTTGNPTSKVRLAKPPSTPLRKLFLKRARPRSAPDRFSVRSVSRAASKGSGNISNESEIVALPSGLNTASKPPVARAVVPIKRVRFFNMDLPTLDPPNFSADLKNLLFAGAVTIFEPCATLFARPSHPIIGMKPRPNPTSSSVTLPAVVVGLRLYSFLKFSKASVTGRE